MPAGATRSSTPNWRTLPARCRESCRKNWAKPATSSGPSRKRGSRWRCRGAQPQFSMLEDSLSPRAGTVCRRTPTPSPSLTVGRPLFRTLNQGRDGWRVLTRYESSPAGDYVILVGGPLDQVEQQHRLLARVLQVATPLIVLMTAGLSWWVASSALRPITILAARGRRDHRAIDRLAPRRAVLGRRGGPTRARVQPTARAARTVAADAALVHGRRVARAADASVRYQNGGGSDARTRHPGGRRVSGGVDRRAAAECAPHPDGRGHAGPRPRRRRRIPADQTPALRRRNRRGMRESGDRRRRRARYPNLDRTSSPTSRFRATKTCCVDW